MNYSWNWAVFWQPQKNLKIRNLETVAGIKTIFEELGYYISKQVTEITNV